MKIVKEHNDMTEKLGQKKQTLEDELAQVRQFDKQMNYRGFSRRPCWRTETMKQFCMKINLISQRRENVLFLPSNMAAMTTRNMKTPYSPVLCTGPLLSFVCLLVFFITPVFCYISAARKSCFCIRRGQRSHLGTK